MTGILPAGSTVMTLPSCNTWAACVLQASPACPLMRMAQEPQMELRQEQRRLRVPSTSSRILMRASRTVALSSTDTGYSCQKGVGSSDSGSSRLTLIVMSIGQYFLSSGVHRVMLTGE